jgi:hypothetical protein
MAYPPAYFSHISAGTPEIGTTPQRRAGLEKEVKIATNPARLDKGPQWEDIGASIVFIGTNRIKL